MTDEWGIGKLDNGDIQFEFRDHDQQITFTWVCGSATAMNIYDALNQLVIE